MTYWIGRKRTFSHALVTSWSLLIFGDKIKSPAFLQGFDIETIFWWL